MNCKKILLILNFYLLCIDAHASTCFRRLISSTKFVPEIFKQKNLFLIKDEELWYDCFSWKNNSDVFQGQPYRSIILNLYMKKMFFNIQNIGGIRYTYRSGQFGFIEAIVIHNDWQRQGLAFELMRQALQDMSKHDVATVQSSVGVLNVASRALHTKSGFESKNDIGIMHKKL